MSFFTKLLDIIFTSKLISSKIQPFIKRYAYGEVININKDLTSEKQKKVLIVYLSIQMKNIYEERHANYYHLNQMIHYFITQNWCVDTCMCNDDDAIVRLSNNEYDLVLGLGSAWRKAIATFPKAQKVLFLTENVPAVVAEKYICRKKYFKQRHPDLDSEKAEARMGYFKQQDLYDADNIIFMSSPYNGEFFKDKKISCQFVVSNAIQNLHYEFNKSEALNSIRYRKKKFICFGCNGLIHKGIDILCDVFSQLPECTLSLYGINEKELPLLKKICPHNVNICANINVQSEEFLIELVKKNAFIILPSCSEGMSTGVVTCMLHGLIPIVSKESGLLDSKLVTFLEEFSVEYITNIIKNIISTEDEKLIEQSEKIIEYTSQTYSLKAFDKTFANAIQYIIADASIVDIYKLD